MSTVTADALRDYLCDFLAWTPPPPLSTLCGWKDSDGIKMLSDPLVDLNACAAFEKTLSEDQLFEYDQGVWRKYGCRATAEQRCREFLEIKTR